MRAKYFWCFKWKPSKWQMVGKSLTQWRLKKSFYRHRHVAVAGLLLNTVRFLRFSIQFLWYSAVTLFKSKKSSQWKWHTSIPSISICVHTIEAKLVIVGKICQHLFSSSVPLVKFKLKMSILSYLHSNFSLICCF